MRNLAWPKKIPKLNLNNLLKTPENTAMYEAVLATKNQELENAQLMRIIELQRFAEFGRLSANLLHEVTNPLTAASLNLQNAGLEQSPALRQVRKSLRQLERYVAAARKQLQNESRKYDFNVARETKELVSVLKPIAQKASVKLELTIDSTIKIYGDPVRFNQIIANLLVNAIDAYKSDFMVFNSRKVELVVKQVRSLVYITVRDWGKGIEKDKIGIMFEPFYTTKTDNMRGLGIGLSIVKQSVVNDFNGTIKVVSRPNHGTIFSIKLKGQRPAKN